ncbi:VOC family protein [Streptosporangium sp. NPDC051022]|uniref:VOC family protein n=1 Tax=Streptosporangium sp. NPDC051022 TaxID=3155752 RepID=UPI00342A2066
MSLSLRYLVFNCVEPYRLARFWSTVLALPIDGGAESCWIELPEGNQPSQILFMHASSEIKGKTQPHVHLNPGGGTLAEEVERLVGLGAVVVSEQERGRGIGWVVMADPEGNEFCVDSSDAEVTAAQA